MLGVALVSWVLKSKIPFRILYGTTAYSLLSLVQRKGKRNFNEKIVTVRKIKIGVE